MASWLQPSGTMTTGREWRGRKQHWKPRESAVDVLSGQAILQSQKIAAAAAEVRAAEAVLKQVRLQHARQRGLIGDGTTSQRELEAAEADDARLSASRDEKAAELGAAKQQLEVIRTQVLQAQQVVKTEEAALELARIDLGYTRIVSPASGQLSERASLPGEYVTVGDQDRARRAAAERLGCREFSRGADGAHVSGSGGGGHRR